MDTATTEMVSSFCGGVATGGDRFEDLLLRVVPDLKRHARRLHRDPGAADDLLQDTLERALRKAERFRPGTNLTAWAKRMMTNVFVDGWRRSPPLPTPQDPETLVAADAAGGELRPWQILTDHDLERALEQLSPRLRETVDLVWRRGMSGREAGETLGVDVGTIASRLFRARQQVRRTLTLVLARHDRSSVAW